jgi:hypothetical protein
MDIKQIKTTFKNDLLEVVLPWVEAEKTNRIAVKVGY